MSNKIFYAVFGLLLGYIIFYSPKDDCHTKIIKKTDTIYQDTGSVRIDTILKPYKVVYTDTITNIDTVEVIKEYYAVTKYSLDSTVNEVAFRLNIQTNKNRISLLHLKVNNLRPTTIVKQVSNPNKWGIGMSVMGGESSLEVYGHIAHQRKKMLYTAGYNPFNKKIQLGAYKFF